MSNIWWDPLLNAMLDPTWVVDPKTLRIVAISHSATQLIGLSQEELLNRPAIEIAATPEDLFFWEDVAQGLANSIHSNSMLRCCDGIAVLVERRVSRVWLSRAEPVFVVTVRDLRPQQQSQEALENHLAELRATLESTGDGILVTGLSGDVRNFNRHFAEMWDVPAAILAHRDDQALHTHMADSVVKPDAYRRQLQALAVDHGKEATDLLHLNSGRILERVSVPQTSRGRAIGRVYSFRDITQRLEAQERIETLAYTDALTSLPNRLMLSQRVELALRIAVRSGVHSAMLFIDLDRFKNINDSLGHAFGDRVLVEVASRFKRCIREVDTLCRIGADEFVVFLQNSDAIGAEVVVRRIQQALAQPFLVDAMDFSLSCSVGIAMYPDDGKTVDDLIQCADTAMHRVKERGRGTFRFYQPQMNVDMLSRMKMDHAMRVGLEQGRFQVHYQPQVALCDGRLLGAEALLRWNDMELGSVSPGIFIPLAEESGFIVTLGNWVLDEAVRQAMLWQQAGHRVVVSVNVSALQFQQVHFVERVAQACASQGLDPALLELELTESILIKDANEALSRLHALAGLGISLAIDDFGTGYSSLAYLKKFPISKLKIDRAFVTGLPQDESDRAIVSATIAMAHALKLGVVAEGVETLAQRDFLFELSCESFQGFLCSPALSVVDFDKFIATLPNAPVAISNT